MWLPRTLDDTIKLLLRFGAGFMLIEAIYHVSGVRMDGVAVFWPASAVVFGHFFMILWASASLILSVFLWILSTNLKKYVDFLVPLAILCIIHSGILYYFSTLSLETLLPVSNLYVWNPYYSWQLRVEALLLDIFGILILWRSRRY